MCLNILARVHSHEVIPIKMLILMMLHEHNIIIRGTTVEGFSN